MHRHFLFTTAIAMLVTAAPDASARSWSQYCQFNGGRSISVRNTDNGGAFTLQWSDGPRMTYVWRGSNADRWNITDTLGGRWNYYDHRTKGGFTLRNLQNGNVIQCF